METGAAWLGAPGCEGVTFIEGLIIEEEEVNCGKEDVRTIVNMVGMCGH